MKAALYRYPWEEDDYAFDFEAFYPPLPEQGPPWLLKLLEVTKDMVRPPEMGDESCPFCNPHVDLGIEICFYTFTDPFHTYPQTEEHPVWAMDSIPDPLHILDHFYGPGMLNERPRHVSPQELEDTKKYLKDVRTSRGYNVDTIPHPGLVDPIDFTNIDLGREFYMGCPDGYYTFGHHVRGDLYCVIDYISDMTGERYHLVEVLKYVMADPMALVTFTAAAAESPYPETFIVGINLMLPRQSRSFGESKSHPSMRVLECIVVDGLFSSKGQISMLPLRSATFNLLILSLCLAVTCVAFYPPLPEQGPPWLLKLREVTKDMVRPPNFPKPAEKNCPFCNPHVDLGFGICFQTFADPFRTYPQVDEHPVWAMDPIPDPLHILDHFYCPGMFEDVNPHKLEDTKKYLKDVRTSRGYNVDTIPHSGLVNPITFANKNLGREFYFGSPDGC